MKKVALFGLLLSLLFAKTAFASYGLTADTGSNSITATLTGGQATATYQIFVLKKPFPAGAFTTAVALQKDSAIAPNPSGSFQDNTKKGPLLFAGPVTWTIPGLSSNTTYYVRVVETKAGKSSYTTDAKTVITKAVAIAPKELTFSYDGGQLLISGRLDPATNPDFEKALVEIRYSKQPIVATDPAYTAQKGSDASGTEYIYNSATNSFNWSTDGSYHFLLPASPSTTYYIQQTITIGNTKQAFNVGDKYNTGSGYIPAGSPAAQTDFESRSYRLLAPFPGLSVLLDPDLCAEKAAEGTKGQICDINDFLNLGFKLLIGAAAVLLVLRIMYEGYKYITTDIPPLKVTAKSGLWDAVLGLVLALSSFLILNTINPKLVENTVNVDRLEIGVLENEEDATPITTQGNITVPAGSIAACTVGIEKISTKGGTFYACKTISSKFKAMIDLAQSQGIKISGGGFRTKDEQIALRASHCGGQSSVYNEKAVCKPPTAYPGRSRHESGLAFDLTCNGQLIRSRDNQCFVWLQSNAKKYDLYNFAKEPWHWSTDGK